MATKAKTAKTAKTAGGKKDDELLKVARACVKNALKAGAQEAAASASQGREVGVQWRDGALEKVHEATTRGVSVELYVDGRYGAVRTGDLRPEALQQFIREAVEMTRSIAKDPYRALPDPKLYEGQAKVDLDLEDAHYAELTPDQRKDYCRAIEASARGVKGAQAILSVTAGFGDERGVHWRVHSNGFEGQSVSTIFSAAGEVSVQDGDRKPEDWSQCVAHHLSDLHDIAGEGRRAAERALEQRGSTKFKSGVMSMAVDHRSAGRLVMALLGPLSGQSLQQKRSFLEGKLGAKLGSEIFTLVDDPLMKRGLGSQLFDGEGIAAKVRPVFEKGALKTYFIDTYYGKKLGVAPTTGGVSNLIMPPGQLSQDKLLERMGDGILVTAFLGGNSNTTTGDYSFGVQGFRVEKGRKTVPVSEMNISGNLGDLFHHLVAIGNDPYLHSRVRIPTLLFEGIQFAGM